MIEITKSIIQKELCSVEQDLQDYFLNNQKLIKYLSRFRQYLTAWNKYPSITKVQQEKIIPRFVKYKSTIKYLKSDAERGVTQSKLVALRTELEQQQEAFTKRLQQAFTSVDRVEKISKKAKVLGETSRWSLLQVSDQCFLITRFLVNQVGGRSAVKVAVPILITKKSFEFKFSSLSLLKIIYYSQNICGDKFAQECFNRLSYQGDYLPFKLLSSHKCYVLMPLLPGKDMWFYLLEHRNSMGQRCKLNQYQRLKMCYAVSLTIEKFHQAKVVHHDLKPTNILIKESAGKKDYIATLIDEDDATKVGEFINRVVGTVGYAAPEIERRLQSNQSHIANFSSDIYSFGMILRDCFREFADARIVTLIETMTDIEPGRRPKIAAVKRNLQMWLTNYPRVGKESNVCHCVVSQKLFVTDLKLTKPASQASRSPTTRDSEREALIPSTSKGDGCCTFL